MTLSRHMGESPDSPFDRIHHEDQNGSEYWLATELLSLFGYKTWRRQKETTEREIISCANAGNNLSKRVRLGQWVSKHNLERQKEKRLVNGTTQSIWCYKVCNELDKVISSFFGSDQ